MVTANKPTHCSNKGRKLVLALLVFCLHIPLSSAQIKAAGLGELKNNNLEAYRFLKSTIGVCVATCLKIADHGDDRCEYDTMTGNALGGVCAKEFFRPTSIDRKMICIYEREDLENGLALDTLIESNLCTDIVVLVAINYIYTNREMVIVDKDLHERAGEMSRMKSVRLMYRIGSPWGTNDSMSSEGFSKNFSVPSARAKWVASLKILTDQPQSVNYQGIFIRWHYPGCPKDNCQVGPAKDEHNLVSALEEFRDAMKSTSKKWDLAMEISAKSINIYMGLGIFKLNKLLTHFFILNYEWAMPQPLKGLRTAFQTPIAKNIDAIKELLGKNKADNKGFFYGVTSNLVRYALDKSKVAPSGAPPDEFSIVSSKSQFIPMSKACNDITERENNYTVVNPRDPQKTSYAKADSFFIPFDETNDIIEKVSLIFKTFGDRIGGAWMKDISSDDFAGLECGCGPFPTLRAANEGLYESTCKMKKCFQHT